MAGQAIVLVTVLAALSQTGDASTRAPKTRVESGPHVSRFAAGEGCVIFNDQAEFEAAMEDSGLGLMGVEGFYGALMPPDAVSVFDDPLCGGIPSEPYGLPFLWGLACLYLALSKIFGWPISGVT